MRTQHRCAALMLLIAVLLMLVPACTPVAPEVRQLTIITHDSFAISEALITAFEAEHNATIVILTAGDAGSLTNQAILNKNAPLGDVLYGIDNTFLSRALSENIFEPYTATGLDAVPAEFRLDPEHRVTPIDFGDVCLNYDRAFFTERDLPVPASLDDLTDPAYRDLLVVENPASSSPGLAFLLATVAVYGPDGFPAYWQALAANGVRIVEDWSTAYYGDFSLYGGDRPLVVSYASSPPAEVYFAEPPIDTPPSGAVVAPGTCYRQIEFAGILQGTPQRALAEAWIDYMLSRDFQQDIPLQMFVFPVNPQAALPEVFETHAEPASQPLQLDPADIAANRDAWLDAWATAVGQ